jgi:hypothetical protein
VVKADARAGHHAGGGVDVFGNTDVRVRTAEGLSRHFDALLTQELSAQGVVIVDDVEVASALRAGPPLPLR